MSQAPPLPSSFSAQFSNQPISTPNYQPTPYTRMPPPPPPKPQQQDAPSSHNSQSGPPLPPPPPTTSHPSHQTPFNAQTPHSPPSQPLHPSIEEHWLPPLLLDKSKADLSHLLSTPALLSALLSSPSTTHPILSASLPPLHHALQTNITLATALLALGTTLTALRTSTETQLLQLHALERQWRLRQSALDTALEPWSPKALHARLVAGIAEQEAYCAALEESFLEEHGRAGEREIGEWVKRYREGRKVLALRRERRARFEEGRVGGWR